MRTNGAKVAVVGGVVVAVVGAGVGTYALMSDSGGGSSSVTSEDDRPRVKTGPPSAAEVRTTARKFLSAWESGSLKKAAALTDSPADAAAALTSYHKDARISDVAFEPGRASQRTVPFKVNAVIAFGTQKAPWQYASELTVTRDKSTGKPVLDWEPSVVHPHLREGDTLKTGEADAPPIKAVDRNGVELSTKSHPALRGVLASLRERYGDKTDGRPGVELWISRAAPKGADAKTRAAERPDETLKVLSKGTPGTLRTTLDARLQSNAEAQVNKHRKAAVVAVKPSTGEILAVANSPADGFNAALQGSYAPGSTMKVITSSLLLEKGLAGYDKPHPCPKYSSYGGWKFQNDKKFEIKDGTFAQSFARSCNTAFITQAKKIKDDALTQQARDVFGIGLNWQTGVPTFDGAVPVQHDAPKAASMIGQGGVRMNPLNMASVAATVQSGTFRQPYLVSPELDNRQLAKAPRTLSADALQQLRALMRLTATSGTAAEPMSGLSGDIGAKTGSAEVMNQKKPNGWLTAYRGDVAAAAVVPEGGHGSDSAGPVVAAILRAG
ncbi:penicillin-binding transpeptidase domain-containing protein [Streptomyces meridianus]|uniref:Penicillin-binding transpeptidase domain-containing protein n=1 Tax=Streptomyces meridianus TaxID=2938945 RepID=A0ABT0XAZ0_9ACTN|nr:penicillin-binding transpeptidase domain-containing protein [Streptomyces meridianus]MCM2579108.1 penicillin-binding transpeptidase domain-containing protein [Streptomyces meridianus]